jgi:hypothetical protein
MAGAACLVMWIPAIAPANAQSRDPEVNVRRVAVQHIPIGATVKLATRDGRRFKGVLFGVDADGIVVKPAGRVPLPTMRVAFERLDAIERDEGRLHYGRYAAVGAAIGGGVLLWLLVGFAGG